jgi:hypothetical protein
MHDVPSPHPLVGCEPVPELGVPGIDPPLEPDEPLEEVLEELLDELLELDPVGAVDPPLVAPDAPPEGCVPLCPPPEVPDGTLPFSGFCRESMVPPHAATTTIIAASWVGRIIKDLSPYIVLYVLPAAERPATTCSHGGEIHYRTTSTSRKRGLPLIIRW